MKSIIFILALCMTTYASARDLSRILRQAQDDVVSELAACDAQVFDAYDGRLPRPRVPADEAFVVDLGNNRFDIKGYYYEEYPRDVRDEVSYQYNRTNGSRLGSIERASKSDMMFYITRGGAVARVTRFFLNGTPVLKYICRNNRFIDESAFMECLKEEFAAPLARTICQQ